MGENKGKEQKRESPWYRSFRLLGIGLDVVIFAVLGYFVGEYYGNVVYGVMVGAILGTFLMWFHLFYATGLLKREKKENEKD